MKTVILFSLFFAAGCAGHGKVVLRSQLGNFDRLIRETASFAPEAPAIYLNDELFVRHAAADGYTTYEYHRVVLIRDEDGLDLATAHIPMPRYGELAWIRASTRLPNGEVIEVRPEDMIDHEVWRFGGEESEPRIMRSFAFPAAAPGAVLELQFVKSFPNYHHELYFALDGGVPVYRAKLAIEPTTGFGFHVDSAGFAQREEDAGDGKRYVFTLSKPYPGPPHVSFRPPEREWVPHVGLSLRNAEAYISIAGVSIYQRVVRDEWKDLGPQLWAMFRGDELSAAADLGAGDLPERQRISKIWRFVQDELEDRAGVVASDEEWTIDRIVKNRRGTSRERARVLLAMLRRAGLNVSPVYLAPDGYPEPRESLPYESVTGGDILAWIDLDGKTIVLDPACIGCAAGEIAFEHQDRTGLVVRKNGIGAGASYEVELTKLPAGAASRRTHTVELTVEKSARGLIARTGRWEFSGPRAAIIRYATSRYGKKDAEEGLRRELGVAEEGGSISLEGTEPSTDPLTVRAQDVLLEGVGFAESAERFATSVEDLAPSPWLRMSTRDRPVDIYLGTIPPERLVWKIKTPPRCRWDTPPAGVSLKTKMGKYQLSVVEEGAELVVTESWELIGPRVPRAQLEAWNRFLGELARARARPLVCRYSS